MWKHFVNYEDLNASLDPASKHMLWTPQNWLSLPHLGKMQWLVVTPCEAASPLDTRVAPRTPDSMYQMRNWWSGPTAQYSSSARILNRWPYQPVARCRAVIPNTPSLLLSISYGSLNPASSPSKHFLNLLTPLPPPRPNWHHLLPGASPSFLPRVFMHPPPSGMLHLILEVLPPSSGSHLYSASLRKPLGSLG